jgi:hypothetical protein
VIIRKEQMGALSANLKRAFQKRMVEHLEDAYPGQIRRKYNSETGEFASTGIAKAERYGIELEGDIETFLDMLVEWSPEFDIQLPWAIAILTDTQRRGSDKITLLQEHERFGT